MSEDEKLPPTTGIPLAPAGAEKIYDALNCIRWRWYRQHTLLPQDLDALDDAFEVISVYTGRGVPPRPR